MTDLRPHLTEVRTALALLSRLPLPPLAAPSQTGAAPAMADAVWAYPLAGALLGALAALGATLAMALGLPPSLAALLCLTAMVAMTGALHEDGLSDLADGFWGGTNRDRRLEIMRDSRIGTYGTAALGLSLLARWQALALILGSGLSWYGLCGALIATAALSRAVMPALMTALPHARADGLSHAVGRPAAARAGIAVAIAVALALICLGFGTALSACLLAGLTTYGLGTLARARIGGQTGDVLGAAQQLAEIAVLFAIAVHISV